MTTKSDGSAIPAPAPATLRDTIFPNEAAMTAALQEQSGQDPRMAEQINHAATTAVNAWLRAQGVDPENPPARWKE